MIGDTFAGARCTCGLNFVARLNGSGGGRALLLMAHSDVVPADRSQWTVPPFAALLRDGFIYGRGAQDDKSLLAAELAVLVELKRRGASLRRPVILLFPFLTAFSPPHLSSVYHLSRLRLHCSFGIERIQRGCGAARSFDVCVDVAIRCVRLGMAEHAANFG